MRIAFDWTKIRRDVVVILTTGTFLGFVQPYNATTHLPIWGGFAYWIGIVAYGSIVGGIVADQMLKRYPSIPGWLAWALISFISTVFITPVLSIVHALLGDYNWLRGAPLLFVFVWVISAALSAIGWLLFKLEAKEEGEGLSKHEDTIRSFMSRLPLPYKNAELYAVASEDHYVRVYTSAGEHLFLEKISSVVHQLKNANGLQTHRSWWVSEDAVKSVQTISGRMTLTLSDDTEVPVSRSFASDVKDAGWV